MKDCEPVHDRYNYSLYTLRLNHACLGSLYTLTTVRLTESVELLTATFGLVVIARDVVVCWCLLLVDQHQSHFTFVLQSFHLPFNNSRG